jgi:UDP-N-acetylmuramyl tripeptide synthase
MEPGLSEVVVLTIVVGEVKLALLALSQRKTSPNLLLTVIAGTASPGHKAVPEDMDPGAVVTESENLTGLLTFIKPVEVVQADNVPAFTANTA